MRCFRQHPITFAPLQEFGGANGPGAGGIQIPYESRSSLECVGDKETSVALDIYSASFDTSLDVVAEAMETARTAARSNEVWAKVGQSQLSGTRQAPFAQC